MNDVHLDSLTLGEVARLAAALLASQAVIYVTEAVLELDCAPVAQFLIAATWCCIILWWAAARLGFSRSDVGLRRGRFPTGTVVVGGVLVGVAWQFLVAAVYSWGGLHTIDVTWFDLDSVPSVLVGINVVLLSPLLEEVYFRGLVMVSLRDRFGLTVGLLGQATLFVLMHFDIPGLVAWEQIATRFVLALLLGAMYRVTGSLYSCIACHVIINLIVFLDLLSWAFPAEA